MPNGRAPAGEQQTGIRTITGPAALRLCRATACAALLAVVAAGCDESTPSEPPPEPRPAAVHVTHISLSPRLSPPDSRDAPPDSGWPDVGQEVTWVAHLLNSGDEPAPGIGFRSDVVILRLTVGDEWGYAFLPVYELNMEWIRGRTGMGEHTLEVEVQ
ncbi:MAG: hypothetical protein ACOC8B_03455 [Gemmatimonadota bacterium]